MLKTAIQAVKLETDSKEREAKVISLRRLTPREVRAIDRAMQEIGETGELHLVIHRGRLKFLERLKTIELETQVPD